MACRPLPRAVHTHRSASRFSVSDTLSSSVPDACVNEMDCTGAGAPLAVLPCCANICTGAAGQPDVGAPQTSRGQAAPHRVNLLRQARLCGLQARVA